eukprot:g2057.t1
MHRAVLHCNMILVAPFHLCLCLRLLLLLAPAALAAQDTLLVTNATAIYTRFGRDGHASSTSALCVSRAAGTILPLGACGPNTEVLDVRGASVFPGFIDSHLHLLWGGLGLLRPQLQNATSPADVVRILRAYVRRRPPQPGAWLQGFGWDQNRFPGHAFPTRSDLDAAFPDTPIWLERIDGHAAWANTAALHAKGVQIPASGDVAGGRIVRDNATGQATGIFTDSAMLLVSKHIPPTSEADREDALTLALRDCASNGLTAIHNPGCDPSDIELYKRFVDAGNMTLRQNAMLLGADIDGLGRASPPSTPLLKDYGGRGLLSCTGVKFFMDGALGSWGAAMLQNYTDRPDQAGQLRIDLKYYASNVTAWAAAGYQVATHAIGDRANRIVIDNYRRICNASAAPAVPAPAPAVPAAAGSSSSSSSSSSTSSSPSSSSSSSSSSSPLAKDLRLRIEHFQIVSPGDIPKINIPTEAATTEQRLGKARLKGAYAWQSVLTKAKAPALALGSDWPTVGKVPPVLGLYAAVTRQDLRGAPAGGWEPQERLTRVDALRGYTRDAAFAAFREHELGALEPGFKADFVVLDRDVADPTRTPAADIWKALVLATYVGGAPVFAEPCFLLAHHHHHSSTSSSTSTSSDGGGSLEECLAERREELERANAETFRRALEEGRDGCPH